VVVVWKEEEEEEGKGVSGWEVVCCPCWEKRGKVET
jgi:hypothetical protein